MKGFVDDLRNEILWKWHATFGLSASRKTHFQLLEIVPHIAKTYLKKALHNVSIKPAGEHVFSDIVENS